jgi:hypothetical protein
MRPIGKIVSLLALVAASSLAGCAGCGPPSVVDEDAGPGPQLSDAGPPIQPVDGGFDDAGEAIIVDAGPVNEDVTVTSITPPSGPMAGGYRVRIEGTGFTGGCSASPQPGSFCKVFFGDVQADLPLPLSLPNAISVRVPPCESPGPVRVRVQTELGIGELEGGFTCFSPITVDEVQPDHGSTEGGTPITLTGQGFTDDMIVTIGGRQVVDLVVDESGTEATAFAPPGEVGRADVTAIDAFGRSVLELGFTYDAPLRVETVTPNVVDDVPGTVVELGGTGFSDEGADEAAATIGGLAATRNNLISDARLRVVVPGGLVGLQDVSVTRGAATSTLDDALFVRPPLTGGFVLSAALPVRGDVAGGTEVTLVGEGLTGTAGVTVGGAPATDVAVVDDRTVTFTAPPGALGATTIEVTRTDASTAQLAWTYFTAVVVDDVAPGFGPVAGGTPVTVTGRGFSDPATVLFGGMPATNVVVVSDTEITATTPAGAAGPVDVVVLSGGERGVLDDGYRFDAALKVIGVRPSRGGVGGDTFVTLTGTGFSRGAVSVTFGGTPALPQDVVVVNDSTITLRTPAHQAQLVDVAVTQGGTTALAEKVYTYFDPTSIVGGTRGGPIDGAVYITALDATLGLPVPGLIAYVGTDGTPTAAGITNVLGQATISGPDVVGPQTVTLVGDCFSSASFVDVNATELTVFVFATCSSPPQPGEGPPPPPPATIRGRVFGFAKEFFDPAALDQSGCQTGPPAKCEIAFAEVRTTSRDEFSGTPPAGGDNVVFEEGGEYFIASSRPGRLAVVALAGIYDLNNDTFRLRQLGVRREVFPQFGVNLEDQDIELTIPLDEEIDLSLPDAPLRFDDAQIGKRPTITRVIPFLQFGGEGAFNYTQAVEGKRNHVLEEMPDVPGEMLTFISGAYTTDGLNLVTEQGSAVFVEGDTRVTGVGTSDWAATDFSGTPLVVGAVIVTDRPDGTRFASVIKGCAPDGFSPCATLQLADPPDFSSSSAGQSYHIGNPGAPSSEVIQDGVGDMRGGITIQPVLGIPEVLSPLENGVLTDRTLRWKAAPGQQPTIHDMFVYEPYNLETIWELYADGSRTKVIIPRVPTTEAILAALPTAERACLQDPEVSQACGFWGDLSKYAPPKDMALGGMVWQHEAIFTPDLDFNNWSLLEIGTRGRRSWTTDVHIFVHGQD